ncbi:Protein of unknown function [Desulfomicrobium apsheronum]|uniref:Uncharacterized protein n=1 Tax=Desulfomicrobium apsheronum TaxID=52560 RepID=A0A1I3X7Q6_9BACT|nr:DUF2569 family protein [Desulfomicrobium apsheronum]SFK15319.1 Protein of unknown function [Desulfomicrobium apsheronum]
MSDKELVGVKGWLLFLVLSLSVLSILGTIASLGQFSIAEHLYPGLKSVDTWQAFKQWIYILALASLSMRFLSAYRLYYKHEKSSVELAIFTLWITGPVLSIFIIILMHSLLDDGLQIFSLKETIINFIGAICWTLYLNKSTRVKNTYYYEQIINKNQYGDKIVLSDPVKQSYLRSINNMSHSIPEKLLEMPVQTYKQDSVKHSEIAMNNNEYSEVFNEDELYLQATNEVEDGSQDKALWAKCMALCEGDEARAKYKYIKERVDRLRDVKVRKIEEERIKYKKNIDNIKFRSLDDKVRKYLDIDHIDEFKEILKQNGCDIILVHEVVQFYDKNRTFRKFQDSDSFVSYFVDTYPDIVKL